MVNKDEYLRFADVLFFFITTHLKINDLRMYRTDVHQIFRICKINPTFFCDCLRRNVAVVTDFLRESRRKLAYPTFVLCADISQRMTG